MGVGGEGGGGGMNSLETSLISPSKFQTELEGSPALIPHSGGGGFASDPSAIVYRRGTFDDRGGANTSYSWDKLKAGRSRLWLTLSSASSAAKGQP